MASTTSAAAPPSPRPKKDYPVYRCVDAALRFALRLLPVRDWTERIALWWGYRFKPAPGAAKLRSGASIHLNPADYLQLLIYYQGTFETHCLPYLRGCATEGGTVIDVGANIGFHTLESALVVGPAGRVIAIEAAPPHAEALRKSLELNAMRNVVLVEAAVGDRTGEALLALPNSGNLGMFTLGPVSSNEAYTVPLTTLDDILSRQPLSSIDLIKIDIEGSEHAALRGAAGTLRTHKPAVLIELNESALRRCGASSQQVKTLLREAGYRGWLIGRRKARPIVDDAAPHECDECLFIHKDREFLVRKLGLTAPAG
jgi:FkbM family methyltransferase